MKKNTQLLNFFATSSGITAIMFGSLYAVFGKILLQNLHPETLLAIGQSLSVFLLLIFFGFLPEIKKIRKLKKEKIIWLICISLISGVIVPLLSLNALKEIQATEAVLFGGVGPIFLGIFGVLFLKEKISLNQIGGFALLIIGIIIMALKGQVAEFSINRGYIFILSACALAAMSNTIFKKNLHHISPEIIVFMRNSIGAFFMFLLIPFFFQFEHDISPLFDKKILFPLTIYVVFVIIGAQLLWYKSLEVLSTTKASFISLLSPLFGVFFSMIILNESLSRYHIWGGVFIFMGLLLTRLHHQKHPHTGILHRIRHVGH